MSPINLTWHFLSIVWHLNTPIVGNIDRKLPAVISSAAFVAERNKQRLLSFVNGFATDFYVIFVKCNHEYGNIQASFYMMYRYIYWNIYWYFECHWIIEICLCTSPALPLTSFSWFICCFAFQVADEWGFYISFLQLLTARGFSTTIAFGAWGPRSAASWKIHCKVSDIIRH